MYWTDKQANCVIFILNLNINKKHCYFSAVLKSTTNPCIGMTRRACVWSNLSAVINFFEKLFLFFFIEWLFNNFVISMNHQNFNDFDIESSFQEDDVIVNPFISTNPSKAVSPTRLTYKVIILIFIIV